MQRNKNSQILKPVSTPESPKTILSTFETEQCNLTLPVVKLRNTAPVHRSHGTPSLVRSLVLPGLVSW